MTPYLIPVKTLDSAAKISKALHDISLPITEVYSGFLCQWWSNRAASNYYLNIDIDQTIIINSDRKTSDLLLSFNELVTSGHVLLSSIQSIQLLDSNEKLVVTISELIPQELLTSAITHHEALRAGFRPKVQTYEETVMKEDQEVNALMAMEYGRNLFKKISAKVLVLNKLIEASGNEITIEQTISLLEASSNLEKALSSAAFQTSIYILNLLKKSMPIYSDAADWAIDDIQKSGHM